MVQRTINVNRVMLLFSGILLALDFTGPAGSYNDELLSFSGLVVGLALIVSYKSFPRYLLRWLLPFLIMIFISTLRGLFGKQSLTDVFVSLVPMVVFVMAVCTFCLATSREDRIWVLKVAWALAMLASINVLLRAVVGPESFALDEVRWRIASSSLLILIAYSLNGFFCTTVKFHRLTLLFCIAIIWISLTRSYVLSLVGMTLFSSLLSSRHLLSWVTKLLYCLVVLAIVVAANVYFDPNTFDNWISRFLVFTEVGFDITGATRLAEANYQISRLMSNPVGFIFGFGFGAESGYSGVFADMVYELLRGDSIKDKGINGFGHNMYLGFIYVGGIFGFLTLYRIVQLFISGVKTFRFGVLKGDKGSEALLFVGLVTLFGMLMYGFLAGLFQSRSTTFIFGMACGFILPMVNATNASQGKNY
jgi:hypothetical protein